MKEKYESLCRQGRNMSFLFYLVYWWTQGKLCVGGYEAEIIVFVKVQLEFIQGQNDYVN